MLHPAERFIRVYEGPTRIVRACTLCGWYDTRRRGVGRGAGFAEGNKQRGRAIQHIKQEHLETLKATRKD